MKSIIYLLLGFSLFACQSNKNKTEDSSTGAEKAAYAMVIHGGAGVILKENMSTEKDSAYRSILNEALDKGEEILSVGGESIDAVREVIMIMENSPLFNAGKGAVFTHNEENELDASIMRGIDMEAGAVGGVRNVKNPITAAIAVMEESEHVLLVGTGAEEFAEQQNLELTEPSYFRTEHRFDSMKEAKAKAAESGQIKEEDSNYKYGTVGCVALDKKGNIVAGTSTGGMTNKKFNRIGDSPIIGAGTYANNKTCGVSCTGHGEYFIRYAVAHDLSAMMEYTDVTIDEAADRIVNEKLVEAGGEGGFVALDANGNIAMPFNTPGMYRGYIKPGERFVGIYKEDMPKK